MNPKQSLIKQLLAETLVQLQAAQSLLQGIDNLQNLQRPIEETTFFEWGCTETPTTSEPSTKPSKPARKKPVTKSAPKETPSETPQDTSEPDKAEASKPDGRPVITAEALRATASAYRNSHSTIELKEIMRALDCAKLSDVDTDEKRYALNNAILDAQAE